tara:strand:- start:305 stop:493 length:189 start_codon:yes stop_codon:yes gene_type:complete
MSVIKKVIGYANKPTDCVKVILRKVIFNSKNFKKIRLAAIRHEINIPHKMTYISNPLLLLFI